MKDLRATKQGYSDSLFRLVKDGKLEDVKKLLLKLKTDLQEEDIQAIINSKNEKGNTALHLAVRSKDPAMLEIAKLLIEEGAKIDIKNKKGNTALHLAVIAQNLDGVNALVNTNLKYDIDALNNHGYSALHSAILTDAPEMVELLKQKGANINVVNEYGSTALHSAATNQNLDEIKRLLDAGIDPNIQKTDGNTALHIAATKNLKEVVDALATNKDTDVNILNRSDATPLSIAMSRGFTKMVENLIENGADINQKSKFTFCQNHGLQSPLKYAADKANDELVGILLKSGKCSLESIYDIDGYETDSTAIKQLLLNYKLLALANQKDANQEAIKNLIENGADVNFKGKDGRPPLLVAMENEHAETARTLIDSNKCTLELSPDNQKLIDNYSNYLSEETKQEILQKATENISKKVKTGAEKKKTAISDAIAQKRDSGKAQADILIDVIVAASERRNPIIRLFSSHSTNTKSAQAVIKVIENNDALVQDIQKIISKKNEENKNSKDFKKELEKYIKDNAKSRKDNAKSRNR
jgi:hypothetical protein